MSARLNQLFGLCLFHCSKHKLQNTFLYFSPTSSSMQHTLLCHPAILAHPPAHLLPS
jgi:hypothetical protein